MTNRTVQRSIILLVFSWCFLQIDTLQSQTLIVDNFNKEPVDVSKKYPSYVDTQGSYDIYYVEANLQLSRVSISENNTTDKVLRLEFTLPPHFSWGNWLSIRREFQSPLKLEDYKGLKLNLRIEDPASDAFLRITLSDLTDDLKQGDEMWWFDCNRDLLKSKTSKWIQVYIPFDGFKVSHGAGTRHNDYKLDLGKIVAYEINLISESRNSQNGIIYLDYLRAVSKNADLPPFSPGNDAHRQ